MAAGSRELRSDHRWMDRGSRQVYAAPMPRKWPRKRPKPGYVRPSRARAKTGWSLSELAALTGVAPRTLRLYLQRGVLPRPPFAGTATRYQRRELLWLLATRRLLETEKLSLAEIRAR